MWLAAAASPSRRRDVLDQRVGAYTTVAQIVGHDHKQRVLAIFERRGDHADTRSELLANRIAECLQFLHVARAHHTGDELRTVGANRLSAREQALKLVATATHCFLEPPLQPAPLLEQCLDALF